MSDDTMRDVAKIAGSVGAWILADEVYLGAELEGDLSSTYWGWYDRLLVTAGLSKAFALPGPSRRVGRFRPATPSVKLWARKDYTSIADRRALRSTRPSQRSSLTRRAKILERTRKILNDQLPLVTVVRGAPRQPRLVGCAQSGRDCLYPLRVGHRLHGAHGAAPRRKGRASSCPAIISAWIATFASATATTRTSSNEGLVALLGASGNAIAGMHFLERRAEEKIREAMERGEFDDLPGYGEAAAVRQSSGYIPEELRLAYKTAEGRRLLTARARAPQRSLDPQGAPQPTSSTTTERYAS